MGKKLQNPRWKNQLPYLAVLAVSIIVFLAVIFHAGIRASKYFKTNSDALIATHQFSKGVEGNTIALPALHANVLMSPILYIQGHLPYTYKSFVAVNTLLIFLTIVSWAILLVKLFGKRYAIPIIWLLSSLLFVSVTFNLDIGNTTFRNLGYPISLWFILIISNILRGNKSRWTKPSIIICSILLTLVLAGDTFFVYSVILPILLVICIYSFWRKILNRKIAFALLLTIGVVAASSTLKFALAALDIIHFDKTVVPKSAFVGWDLLFPSIKIALKQIIELQGAFIFGKTLSLSSLGYLANFAVLLTGLAGLIGILVHHAKKIHRKQSVMGDHGFVLVVAAAGYFIIILEYILSGYVTTQLESGEIIDQLNSRYITFLPLLLLIGVVWIIKMHFKELRFLVLLCIILGAGILASHGTVSKSYATELASNPVPQKESIDFLITALTINDVDRVVTDFWYGPPLRFWSHDRIQYTPQSGCNRPLYFDSREDWYTPEKNIKSALIINREDAPFGYWNCSDEDLVKIYGEPVNTFTTNGVRGNAMVKIWIYDYDVRERMLPFPSK